MTKDNPNRERQEDRLDVREARKALKDGRRIPYEQVRKELGLDKNELDLLAKNLRQPW